MENYLNQTANKSIVDSFDLTDPETSEAFTDYDKDTLLFNIINKGGSFEPLYTDPDFFYSACSYFWSKWKKPFEKMFSAMNMEYNPIHNYDSHEVYSGSSSESGNVGTTDVRTGTMSETVDQDTTNTNSDANTSNTEDDGSVINMVSAFDSTDTVVHDSSTTENTTNVNETNVSAGSGTMDQTTNTSSTDSNVVNTDSSKEITDGHTIDKSGNIGVTTSQQMLESEFSLRLKNIYDIMASEFLKAMTLRVY